MKRAVVLIVALLLISGASGADRNIAWCGNSFTFRNNIPGIVTKIAKADGKDPYIYKGGDEVCGMADEVIANPSNTFYMTHLDPGEHWDQSVMQAFSSRPTTIGDPEDFHESVEVVQDHVITHSPNVEGILYEVWARPVRNTNPPPYEWPYSASYSQETMQLELHTNYLKAAEDIVARGGKARLAPCGQAWKTMDWNLNLYDGDYHQNIRGALLNGMVIYRTLYFEKLSDIDIDNSYIQQCLSDLGLDNSQWIELSAVADAMEISPPVDQPGNLLFVHSTQSADEEGGAITIEVQRMGGLTGAVSVDFHAVNGTAVAGQDYVATNGTLTWSDDDWSNKYISVSILNDGAIEGDNETFSLCLTNPANGAGLWAPSNTIVTIDDDETISHGEVTLQNLSYQVGESSENIEITVQRENGKDGAVSATWHATGLSALDGVDFIAASGVLTWTNHEQADKTFNVEILDDTEENSPVTVNLALDNFTGGVSAGTTTQAVLSIINDDFTPVSLGAYLFTGADPAGDSRTPHDEGNASDDLAFGSFTASTASSANNVNNAFDCENWEYSYDDAIYIAFTVTPVHVDTHAVTFTSIDFDIVRVNADYDNLTASKKCKVKLFFLGAPIHTSEEMELTGHLTTNHLSWDFEDVYATYEAIEFRFYMAEDPGKGSDLLLVDNVEVFGAVFCSGDIDSDGLPDDWETTYFGDLSANPGDPAANGINTVQETYIAGLNPTNAASVFCINQLDLDSGAQLGWFPGVSGRVYSVYWTSNLLSGFLPLASNLPWTANAFTDTTHNAYDESFYRVKVKIEP